MGEQRHNYSAAVIRRHETQNLTGDVGDYVSYVLFLLTCVTAVLLDFPVGELGVPDFLLQLPLRQVLQLWLDTDCGEHQWLDKVWDSADRVHVQHLGPDKGAWRIELGQTATEAEEAILVHSTVFVIIEWWLCSRFKYIKSLEVV